MDSTTFLWKSESRDTVVVKGPSPVQEHTAEVAELLQESPCEWIVCDLHWKSMKNTLY